MIRHISKIIELTLPSWPNVVVNAAIDVVLNESPKDVARWLEGGYMIVNLDVLAIDMWDEHDRIHPSKEMIREAETVVKEMARDDIYSLIGER